MKQKNEHPLKYTSHSAIAVPAVEEVSQAIFDQISTSGESDEAVQPGIKEQLLTSPEHDVDIVIIGSGPAGYYGAIHAAQLGAKVVVVEKSAVGGVCLNVGCIPTKTLLGSVAVLNHVKDGKDFGIDVKGFDLNISRMMERKNAVVKQLVGGVEGLFRKNKIKLVRGKGRITDANTVTVETAEGTETISADKILIATGSVPALLPIENLEIGPDVWTSTEALEFDSVPKSLLVIGAGAIGLEVGYTFARLGTDVLIVEMMPQLIPAADTETAKLLQKRLETAGIKFKLNSTVTRVDNTKSGKKTYIKSDAGEEALEFEKVLVAVGRRAVLKDIGLEAVGVKTDGRKILVNEHMQTNVPNIYAAGDCVGEPMLAHVGWAEAVAAVEHAMGMDSKMDYKAIPACVYTTPECASVGLTEEQARERYKDIRIGKFTFAHNGKALGIGEAEGFIKFITEPRYGAVLGVHMVGPHVTDLVAEVVLAVKNELTLDEVIATIHPHPTLSEVVQEAAMDAEGRAIHK